MTALHFAADKGFDAIVKILVEYGANVNSQDSDGQTPLMYAIICSYQRVIDVLLSSSAIDLSLTNEDGDSVWDLVANDEEMLTQLKDIEKRSIGGTLCGKEIQNVSLSEIALGRKT
jgi:ankyrin repeat protein